jgi:hypothetical protein
MLTLIVASFFIVLALVSFNPKYQKIPAAIVVWIVSHIYVQYRRSKKKTLPKLQTDLPNANSTKRDTSSPTPTLGVTRVGSSPSSPGSPLPRTQSFTASSIPIWVPDDAVTRCYNDSCGQEFGVFRRKHHCRFCKQIFCNSCTIYRIDKQRACHRCFTNKGYIAETPAETKAHQIHKQEMSKESKQRAEKLNISNPKQLADWFKLEQDLIEKYLADDKLFLAWGLTEDVLLYLQTNVQAKKLAQTSLDLERTLKESKFYQSMLQQVEQTRAMLNELASNEGWTLVRQSRTGDATHYRPEPGKDSHSFKLSGVIECDLWRIVAIIYEISLFPTWFPFCKAATDLRTVSRFHKLCTLTIGTPWPFGDRFLVLDGYGVDVSENNQLIVNVKSIESSPVMELPPTPSGAVKVIMHFGGFLLEPVTRKRSKISFIVNVDPKISVVPMQLINWMSGQLIHVILNRMREAVNFGPDSEYAQRVQSNPAVYDYIKSRLEDFWREHPELSS